MNAASTELSDITFYSNFSRSTLNRIERLLGFVCGGDHNSVELSQKSTER
jgi:hypothetical protein